MRLYKNANITHKYFQIMKIHTKICFKEILILGGGLVR